MVGVPDEINMTKMLIGIKEDISSIKQQLNDQADLNAKTDKALAKSIENEHRIDNLTHINYALISLVATGIIVPLIIYLIEKFM
ncbi:hemolysin XhlA family protein [Lentilactobacillus buchneri]|uniref:hemolysin XhlA family protein n=1 Tax=Lentilactobacillus buchneri TaxID=1581 RepID=UPI0002076052|nr:hemolysin XhlA family protein [Lentilactobacillus buchneri]AEB73757.1 hypothetical protein Lbuc_1505 [Lentilactobacillus buchneri NRRL B-30929]